MRDFGVGFIEIVGVVGTNTMAGGSEEGCDAREYGHNGSNTYHVNGAQRVIGHS